MNYSLYNQILRNRGYIKIKDFFNDAEKAKLLNYFDEIENLKEEKDKQMIYFEDNNQKSRVEYFYNYHSGIRQFINNKLNPFLNSVLGSNQILFKDKMNWKYPHGNGFKAHQDHLAWNDFDVSIFHSIALSGNISNKENGCLQFSDYDSRVILDQSSNIGEITDKIDETLDWTYVETTPADLVIFNSFVPHKSDKNISENSRRIMYLTFNNEEEGNYYEEYNKRKREFFPPNIERIKEYSFKNNKYNLANPLK
jgi:2-aminoethylphosphonate dioxygenase